MSPDRHYVEGELYLSLETVAETYEVATLFIREAFELGLLGRGVRHGSSICIAAVQLDRVSTIVRLHRTLGLDMNTIEWTLLGP